MLFGHKECLAPKHIFREVVVVKKMRNAKVKRDNERTMLHLTDLQNRNIAINSSGPFVHSSYVIDGEKLSHEGPLSGRADYLVSNAIKALATCKPGETRILDVGSYDGFILNKLHSAGFPHLVGLEPREENIARGEFLRRQLGLMDGVRHYAGTLEGPGSFSQEDPFDYTLCFGVVHHLNDVVSFMKLLHKTLKPGGVLLLETLVLRDSIMTGELHQALEPKDLIYRESEIKTSFIGVKLESDYYPGSAVHSGTVQIPSLQTLLWFLEFSGFRVDNILPGWEVKNPGALLMSSHRSLASSVFIQASAVQPILAEEKFSSVVIEYEKNMTFGVLDKDILGSLATEIGRHPKAYNSDLENFLVSCAEGRTRGEVDLLRAIIHDPETKLKFELAKLKLKELGFEAAKQSLIDLVSQLGTDWRTSYRAFYLLASFDSVNQKFWLESARRCQPKYPLAKIEPTLFWVSSRPVG